MRLLPETIFISYADPEAPPLEFACAWRNSGRPFIHAARVIDAVADQLKGVGLPGPLPRSLFRLLPLSSALRQAGIRRVLLAPGNDLVGPGFTLRSALDEGFEAFILETKVAEAGAVSACSLAETITLAEAWLELDQN